MDDHFEILPDLDLPKEWNDKSLSVTERAASQFESNLGPTFNDLKLGRYCMETDVMTQAKYDSAFTALNFVYGCMEEDRKTEQKLMDEEFAQCSDYDSDDPDYDDRYNFNVASNPYMKENILKMANALRFNYLFDIGLQKFPKYQQEALCWCPCSRYQQYWRNQFNITYIDERDTCDFKKASSVQSLADHLAHKASVGGYFHTLVLQYLKQLYPTVHHLDKDPNDSVPKSKKRKKNKNLIGNSKVSFCYFWRVKQYKNDRFSNRPKFPPRQICSNLCKEITSETQSKGITNISNIGGSTATNKSKETSETNNIDDAVIDPSNVSFVIDRSPNNSENVVTPSTESLTEPKESSKLSSIVSTNLSDDVKSKQDVTKKTEDVVAGSHKSIVSSRPYTILTSRLNYLSTVREEGDVTIVYRPNIKSGLTRTQRRNKSRYEREDSDANENRFFRFNGIKMSNQFVYIKDIAIGDPDKNEPTTPVILVGVIRCTQDRYKPWKIRLSTRCVDLLLTNSMMKVVYAKGYNKIDPFCLWIGKAWFTDDVNTTSYSYKSASVDRTCPKSPMITIELANTTSKYVKKKSTNVVDKKKEQDKE